MKSILKPQKHNKYQPGEINFFCVCHSAKVNSKTQSIKIVSTQIQAGRVDFLVI